MAEEMELKRGFLFVEEKMAEFSRRGYSIEKMIAIAFESGIEIGACEQKAKFARCFLPNKGNEWP